MNTPQWYAFLDSVRHAYELPVLRRGELESRLATFACVGCGEGKDCKRSKDWRPCYECNACNDGKECDSFGPCDACFWCGCPKCIQDFDMYDGCDRYPGREYRERVAALEPKLVRALKQSPVPLESWAPFLSKYFICKYFPYTSNKELWRLYVLDASEPTSCPHEVDYNTLSEEEKVYFKNPYEKHRASYNILRIMAGLGGLAYDS